MTDRQAPQIEFPCAYPIKVMGEDVDNFSEAVLQIIRCHAPDLDETSISYRSSRNGRYLSLRVTITATGESQLKAMFEELKASGRVQMVL